MSYKPIERQMSNLVLISSTLLFACVIVASNYLVSFRVGDLHFGFGNFSFTLSLTHVTYGAITYPFSFLIMDILSEKFNRKDVLKALRIGLLLAFIPSLYIADSKSIAIASVSAFFISQFLDVVIFYRLKQKFPTLWWLRSGMSSAIAQCVDTFVFFHVAFFFTLPYYDVIMLFVFDYCIKLLVNLADMPLFYLLAIKTYKKIKFIKR